MISAAWLTDFFFSPLLKSSCCFCVKDSSFIIVDGCVCFLDSWCENLLNICKKFGCSTDESTNQVKLNLRQERWTFPSDASAAFASSFGLLLILHCAICDSNMAASLDWLSCECNPQAKRRLALDDSDHLYTAEVAKTPKTQNGGPLAVLKGNKSENQPNSIWIGTEWLDNYHFVLN